MIIGTVTTDGVAVEGAPIQAKNQASGAVFRTLSSATGAYSLTHVVPGTYELSLRMPGFKFVPFLKSDVVIAAEQPRRVDIGLTIGNLDTIADDPFTFLADIRAKAAQLLGIGRTRAAPVEAGGASGSNLRDGPRPHGDL